MTTILHPDQVPDSMESIIWNDRLPQAITALLVGAALGVAGAEMQTVLDNPLAEPYTLGISMSAAFGASLVMAFGVGIGLFESYATVILAFVFSMVACGAIFLISRRRRSDRVTIILAVPGPGVPGAVHGVQGRGERDHVLDVRQSEPD